MKNRASAGIKSQTISNATQAVGKCQLSFPQQRNCWTCNMTLWLSFVILQGEYAVSRSCGTVCNSASADGGPTRHRGRLQPQAAWENYGIDLIPFAPCCSVKLNPSLSYLQGQIGVTNFLVGMKHEWNFKLPKWFWTLYLQTWLPIKYIFSFFFFFFSFLTIFQVSVHKKDRGFSFENICILFMEFVFTSI